MTTFADLGVPGPLVDALGRRGITAPFPIQTATIADALAGRDLCGRAPTGSGKTLAFSLPVAARVGAGKPGRPARPRALILVPTRELASQVCDTIRPLAQARGRHAAAFYGGTSIGKDQQRLRRGIDIVIACPGRLADLVQRGDVRLDDVDLVVIDEADRMADMGFLPEVRRLLDATSPTRQTLLFSATLDGDVDVLIRRYQTDPVRHELVADLEDQGDVHHHFWAAEASDRVRITGELVKAVSPAIVFTRTKHGADRVAKQLARHGVTAAAIHGDRSQGQRERALAAFTSGAVHTLVATDVAARGIHVDRVGMVVHFDPPTTDKDYVHRSGRTGRAGADGVVVTLVVPDKAKDVKALQRALAMPEQVGPVAVERLRVGAPVAPGSAPAPAPAPQAAAARSGAAAPKQGRPRGPRQEQPTGRGSRGGRGARGSGAGGAHRAGGTRQGSGRAGTARGQGSSSGQRSGRGSRAGGAAA